MKYNNPEEFLKDLQTYLKSSSQIKGEGHEEFTRMTEEQLKKIGALDNQTKEELLESNIIVDKLVQHVYDILDSDDLANVKRDIAFGKVMNTFCNALCVKSEDNKYAILIYQGLLTLLHKHGKLILASQVPKSVLTCSRGKTKIMKSKHYKSFADELIENYKKWGSPIGAMIKLDDKHNMLHAQTLHLQELFVLCHELGHYFNGDLKDKNNFYHLNNIDWNIFDDNKDHLMEYKADLTGFKIFEMAVNKIFDNKLPRKYLIIPLSQLFDLLAMITTEASKSHPHPIDRILNIIEHNYGESVAKDFLKTYDVNSNYSVKDFFQEIQ